MADLNKVMLIGRLTRDPQLKYLQNQSAVCDFGIAVGRKWKTPTGEAKEETTFIDCVMFGKSAETFNQYMAKGKPVYLEGRLKLDQWDDKATGQKRSKLSVLADNFQFLDSKGGDGGGETAAASRPGGYGGNRLPAKPAPAGGGDSFTDDDVPFAPNTL